MQEEVLRRHEQAVSVKHRCPVDGEVTRPFFAEAGIDAAVLVIMRHDGGEELPVVGG
jgi:hypothetical protein